MIRYIITFTIVSAVLLLSGCGDSGKSISKPTETDAPSVTSTPAAPAETETPTQTETPIPTPTPTPTTVVDDSDPLPF